MTAIPAANLPLIDVVAVDRLGEQPRQRALAALAVDRRRTRTRCPTSGTSSAARAIVGTPPTWSEPPTNSDEEQRGLAGHLRRRGADVGRDEVQRHDRPRARRRRSSTKNRTLPRWSASSLAAIVRQPPDGAFSARRAARRRRRRAGRCQRARPSMPSGTKRAVELQQVGAAPAQVDEREPGRRRAPRRAAPRRRRIAVTTRSRSFVAASGSTDRDAGHGAARPGRSRAGSPSTPTSSWIVRSAPRASSSSGPAATSRPAEKNPTRSHRRLDLAEDVRREQDREVALRDEPPEQREQLLDAGRVDRDRRLVEDQHGRALHQRVRDAEPLAHAARVGLGLLVARRPRAGPRPAARRSGPRPRSGAMPLSFAV